MYKVFCGTDYEIDKEDIFEFLYLSKTMIPKNNGIYEIIDSSNDRKIGAQIKVFEGELSLVNYNKTDKTKCFTVCVSLRKINADGIFHPEKITVLSSDISYVKDIARALLSKFYEIHHFLSIVEKTDV